MSRKRILLKLSASSDLPTPEEAVKVNDDEPLELESDLATIKLKVRIQGFHIRSNYGDIEKTTSKYFSREGHRKDNLSIQFAVQFKEPVNGNDLVWGNVFDGPIRHLLPFGFNMGYKVFHHVVDSTTTADFTGDNPYMLGYALTSINIIQGSRANDQVQKDYSDIENQVEEVEGEDEEEEISSSGETFNIDKENGDISNGQKFGTSEETLAPSLPVWQDDLQEDNITDKPAKARKTHFSNAANRCEFTFQPDQVYYFDFFTPFLQMSDRMAIKFPGFSFDVTKYADKTPMSFTLKNKKTGKAYLRVKFGLDRATAGENS
jgi:hypothetical protein